MKKISETTFNKIGLKPLDVVLFHGKGVSRVISIFEKYFNKNHSGEWSHCGVVVNATLCKLPIDKPNAMNDNPEDLYILESTYSGTLSEAKGVPDIYGDTFLGVQIRNLRDVLTAYSSRGTFIGVCSPIKQASEIGLQKFAAFINEYYGAPYAIPCCLLKPLFPKWIPCRTKDCIFCSELVVRVFQHLGILPLSIDPQTIDPSDLLDLNFTTPAKKIECNGNLLSL